MYDPMLPLSGLSPVAGKKVVVNFDGGLLSSDGGLLALREVERPLFNHLRPHALTCRAVLQRQVTSRV